ncbi:hypothetical protein 1 [Hubei tombus-like virus 14]|uniref:hypothetical protein 1 n=1 Tax=Hubei tombus-like virus 14 TaxID=1923260 RepID=UPI00090B03B3|nr:hypothetical protein 1 [Hubei tombus-like virus 14]APG76381.1 hypothetical protein 1 [Hubei tombus-like virus 14]
MFQLFESELQTCRGCGNIARVYCEKCRQSYAKYDLNTKERLGRRSYWCRAKRSHPLAEEAIYRPEAQIPWCECKRLDGSPMPGLQEKQQQQQQQAQQQPQQQTYAPIQPISEQKLAAAKAQAAASTTTSQQQQIRDEHGTWPTKSAARQAHYQARAVGWRELQREKNKARRQESKVLSGTQSMGKQRPFRAPPAVSPVRGQRFEQVQCASCGGSGSMWLYQPIYRNDPPYNRGGAKAKGQRLDQTAAASTTNQQQQHQQQQQQPSSPYTKAFLRRERRRRQKQYYEEEARQRLEGMGQRLGNPEQNDERDQPPAGQSEEQGGIRECRVEEATCPDAGASDIAPRCPSKSPARCGGSPGAKPSTDRTSESNPRSASPEARPAPCSALAGEHGEPLALPGASEQPKSSRGNQRTRRNRRKIAATLPHQPHSPTKGSAGKDVLAPSDEGCGDRYDRAIRQLGSVEQPGSESEGGFDEPEVDAKSCDGRD